MDSATQQAGNLPRELPEPSPLRRGDWLDAAARRADLRGGCLADQVLFRAGGTSAIPLADISMPVTAAQADALAGRL